MFVASEDETREELASDTILGNVGEFIPNRSVMAKAERIFPSNKGSNHCFCCSGVPYLAKTSVERYTDEG